MADTWGSSVREGGHGVPCDEPKGKRKGHVPCRAVTVRGQLEAMARPGPVTCS
jgi:hypothetical protein